jgi:hypothetical protein
MAVWLTHIHLGDVFHNEEMTFEQRRDVIVQRLRASPWLVDTSDSYLENVVKELGDADTVEWFDTVWDILYDCADRDRVWIDTMKSGEVTGDDTK